MSSNLATLLLAVDFRSDALNSQYQYHELAILRYVDVLFWYFGSIKLRVLVGLDHDECNISGKTVHLKDD